VTGFRLREQQLVARPVEIGELQPLDVDPAQPEPGDQQDDRVIPFPARIVTVDRGQDRGDLTGIPDRRDPCLSRRAGRRYRVQTRLVDQADGSSEQQP